jgi:hypothetical protein
MRLDISIRNVTSLRDRQPGFVPQQRFSENLHEDVDSNRAWKLLQRI